MMGNYCARWRRLAAKYIGHRQVTTVFEMRRVPFILINVETAKNLDLKIGDKVEVVFNGIRKVATIRKYVDNVSRETKGGE